MSTLSSHISTSNKNIDYLSARLNTADKQLKREISCLITRDSFWLTSDREYVRVRDMADSHLVNLIDHLKDFESNQVSWRFREIMLEELEIRKRRQGPKVPNLQDLPYGRQRMAVDPLPKPLEIWCFSRPRMSRSKIGECSVCRSKCRVYGSPDGLPRCSKCGGRL